MVNVGDTVLVTIPTYRTASFGALSALQGRLQQAGFNVLRIDDTALPWLGVLSGRGQLLITLVPTTSSYATVYDIASLVAGAAYAVGFDINAGTSGQVIALAGPGSQNYQNLQNTPNVAPDLKLPSIPASWLIVGGVTFAVILFLKR